MAEAASYEYENVNGFKLLLKIEESGSPKSITFTITYKNNKINCSWSKLFMIFTLILYIGSFIHTHITLHSTFVSAVIILVLHIFWATHSVKSETLTVVPTIGLQISVQYMIGNEEKFVPWPKIDDVIINEVIKMNRVLYFLTVLVKCEPEADRVSFTVLPLFKYTKPRLQLIEKVYSEIHHLLKDEACNEAEKMRIMEQINLKSRDRGDEINNERKSTIHGDIG